MIEIVYSIVILILGVCCIFTPLQFRLFLVLVLSVPQFYVLPIGVDISIAYFLPFLLVPDFFICAKHFIGKPLTLTVIMLIFVFLISLLWSTKIMLGIRDVLFLLEFLLIISGIYRLTLVNEKALFHIINMMLILITIEAITIVLFRVFPELKLQVMLSSIIRFFIGNNVVQSLVDGMRNNFFDPEKSGGILFINANTAACYMGISSFLTWFLYKVYRRKTSAILGSILWISVFFTGSKAGIIFAVVIPLVYWTCLLKKSGNLFLMLICLCLPCIILLQLVASNFQFMDNDFLNSSIETAETRYEIWDYAWSSFLKNPIFGQGFGGWEEDYSKNHNDFPPHNTLIYLWSKSGLLAVILGIIFMFQVIKIASQSLCQSNMNAYYSGITLLMVSTWLFIHGLGENFGLIGEPHQMIILSVLLGHNLSNMSKAKDLCYENNCNIQKSVI